MMDDKEYIDFQTAASYIGKEFQREGTPPELLKGIEIGPVYEHNNKDRGIYVLATSGEVVLTYIDGDQFIFPKDKIRHFPSEELSEDMK